MYIFGYGSLINPESASGTLGRQISVEEMKIVKLEGYIRTWRYIAWVRLRDDKSPTAFPAVFLDLQPAQGSKVNGVLLQLSDEELANMDRREKGYDRIDVTKLIIPEPDATVYTYVGSQERTRDVTGARVMAKYQHIVDEGLTLLGKEFKDQYYRSTLSHDFPIQQGDYQFVDPEQNEAAGRF